MNNEKDCLKRQNSRKVMKLKNWYIYSALLLSLAGCSFFSGNDADEEVVAKVGDKLLLRRDLAQSIPVGMTQTDSTSRADELIQQWVKQELMLQMAEENLDASQKDVQQELDEYRNSLIIHRYQQQLLIRKMDTTLTEADLVSFYNTHPDKFILEQSIVKGIYMEVPKDVAKPEQIKRWIQARDDRSKDELEKYSFQYATKFDQFRDRWVDFGRIRSRMPFRYDNTEEFLRRNNYYETQDLDKYYFLYVSDFKLSGEKAPFDFVKDRIESLILNTRKMEFIQQVEKNIFQEGKEKNKFEIIDFK